MIMAIMGPSRSFLRNGLMLKAVNMNSITIHLKEIEILSTHQIECENYIQLKEKSMELTIPACCIILDNLSSKIMHILL